MTTIYRTLILFIATIVMYANSMHHQETEYKVYYWPQKKDSTHTSHDTDRDIYAGYYTHNPSYLYTRGELRHALFGLRKYIRDRYHKVCHDKISYDAYTTFEQRQAEYVISTMHTLVRQECAWIYNDIRKTLPESSRLRKVYIPELQYVYNHPERIIDLYANNSPERRLSGSTTTTLNIPTQTLDIPRSSVGSRLSPRRNRYDESPTNSDGAASPRMQSHSPPQRKSWNQTFREYFRATK